MCNGIIYIKSVLLNEEPKYLNKEKSINKDEIEAILNMRKIQLEKYIEDGNVARCKMNMLEQEIKDLEKLLEDK